MPIEVGRKGRLQVIKSMIKKLKKHEAKTSPFYSHRKLLSWLMLKHGYSMHGGMSFLNEMEYTGLILRSMRENERKRGNIKESYYRLTAFSKRSKSLSAVETKVIEAKKAAKGKSP